MAEKKHAAGLIRLFVRHPNAANLLAAIMVLLGIFALTRMNTQFFPTLEVPRISVSVAWPGASAEDVTANILEALEPELRFLDGIDEVTSTAREGSGTISMEFESDANMDKALSDVESAVGRVTTLPEDSERPIVNRIAFYESVASVVVYGPFSEVALKEYAKQIRDGLLESGIDRVVLNGARDEELWVTVGQGQLRRLDLTVADIAARIGEISQDLPSGTVEGVVDRQVRSIGEVETPETLRRLEVKALPSGEKVLLRDIALVERRFDKDANEGRWGDKRAINLDVQRAVNSDTLEVADKLETYLQQLKPALPPTLQVVQYDVRANRVIQRISLLVKNGLGGLVIVLFVLFVFLNMRIAFWVAFGIPVAMMATLAVMWASGQSINMVSLFALILTLGIIVDDAIVVGEHTATRRALGDSPVEAAERGAGRMLAPVIAAMLTTQVAFLPLLLVTGRIGDIIVALPLVVVAVLIASLIECFLILPGHLSHVGNTSSDDAGRFRRWFDSGFAYFRDHQFRRFAQICFRWRYTTVAAAIGILILSVGLMVGGRAKFQFFPSPEPETIFASAVFGAGTPRVETERAMQRIEESLRDVETKLGAATGDKLVLATYASLGKSGSSTGDNLARLEVELTAAEDRTVRTKDIARAWRSALPKIPGLERITVTGRRAGPPGRDIDIELSNADPETLKKAALEVRNLLSGFPGVSAINDDLPYGKQEIILEPTPKGLALGFTTETIGRQVRNAFEGAIARRFARGDEEITIRVKEDDGRGGYEALRRLYLRSPTGEEVPLSEVASLRERVGFSVIRRKAGRNKASVTADVDAAQADSAAILSSLDERALPELAAKYGIDYKFGGRAEEQRESFRDLGKGLQLALILIYIILAWVFGSYAKPFVVMFIIPFGIVGAIVGHMVMGFALTILSMFALLGLSGILVNDSIILMSRIAERMEEGESAEEAAVGGAQDRLRAVLLTSLTTIGGLFPLMFEKSLQAQFLLPMAITLVFGLAVATLLVLILVPAALGVQQDLANGLRRYWAWAKYGRRVLPDA